MRTTVCAIALLLASVGLCGQAVPPSKDAGAILTQRHYWRKHYTRFPPVFAGEGAQAPPKHDSLVSYRYDFAMVLLHFNRSGCALLLMGYPPPWSFRMWMGSTLVYGRAGNDRVECAREGNQETEASVFIEKALLNKHRPLPADLARMCQQLLDERTNVMRLWGMRCQDIAPFGWQESSHRLYDAAGEVAKALASHKE